MQGSWARESGIMNSTFMRGATLLNTVVIVTVITGLLKRMSKEDKALRDLATKEWDEWARRVPYKLIPWIF
jgi:protein-S-isoprenylcysteine O-methyltransferase Ste14